jgi:hypothetical protein
MAGSKINFDLPWVRLPGEPQEGYPRLNRQNFFLLACREAFRKGNLTSADETLLSSLQVSLGLPKKDAFAFARLAKQEFDQGKTSGYGELDAKDLFRKGCAFAEAKGKPLKEERTLLTGFAEALGVPMMQVDSTLRQLAVKMAKPTTEQRPKIKLKRGSGNLDGSKEDHPNQVPLGQTGWQVGGGISDESMAGLHVMPTPGVGAPHLGGMDAPPPPPRRRTKSKVPKAPVGPTAAEDFLARRSAFFHLGFYLLLGGGAAWYVFSSFQGDETASMVGLILGLLVVLTSLLQALRWLFRMIWPVRVGG